MSTQQEASVAVPVLSWSAESIDMARAAGFWWDGGRVSRALSPHVKRDGWPWVKRAWAAYLKSRPFLDWDLRAQGGLAKGEPVRDTRFVSPADFAVQYGLWDLRITPGHLVPIKKQQHLTGDLSAPPEATT